MIINSQFTVSKPIDYKVPENKLIYENYIEAKLSPSSNFEEPHFNVGCSILYEAYLRHKSTFTLKGNTIINIINLEHSLFELSKTGIYSIKGSITIAGEKYSFHSCKRTYDNDNNDSQIAYDKIGLDTLYYNFNILDLLPPITD